MAKQQAATRQSKAALSRTSRSRSPALRVIDVNGEPHFGFVSALRYFKVLGVQSAPMPSATAYAKKMGIKPDVVVPSGGGVELLFKMARMAEFKQVADRFIEERANGYQQRAAEMQAQKRAEREAKEGVKAAPTATDGRLIDQLRLVETRMHKRISELETKLDELTALTRGLAAMWEPVPIGKEIEVTADGKIVRVEDGGDAGGEDPSADILDTLTSGMDTP